MRLDKFLADCGFGTRSEVKVLIKKGFVKVDDTIIKSSSFNFDESKSKVYFKDELIKYKKYYYLLLNKPTGVVSAVQDNIYSTVIDLVEEYNYVDLFPVGRLDIDTTGTLLLTNDGELCHRLLSPRYHVDKTYYIETDLDIKKEMIQAFKEGIELDGELTLPGELVILENRKALLTIHQGKFHQVKRMFQHFGLTVTKLDRKTFAFLNHEDLKLGEYRELSEEEVNKLYKLVNL